MKDTPGLAEDFRLYRRILGYMWPHRWVFVLAVIGMLLTSLATAGFTSLMKPLVDNGFVDRDALTMRWLPLAIVGLFAARGLTTFVGEYYMEWLGRRISLDIRNACFARLLRLPCEFFDLNATGRIITRFTFNVERIAASVTQALIVVIGDGLTAIVLFGYLFWLDWKLTLIMLAVMPVTMTLVRIMSKGFRRKSRKIQELVGEIARTTQEAVQGHRVVKAFGAEEHVMHVFADVNERNRRQILRKKALAVGGMALVQIVSSIGLAIIVYLWLRQAASTAATAGGFVSYLATLIWLGGPLRRLARINETLQTGFAAASNVFALLDEPNEQDDATTVLPTVRGAIEYRNVSFRYPSGKHDALRGISFKIEPGQTVALVGASGSGKTTLASLLPRFYRPIGGEIVLDGINIADVTLASLREQIALVGQDSMLFNDTLANNIAYSTPGMPDRERVIEAARAAHVLEFAEHLPAGFDSPVGERGSLLSGGQRQRVSIARALYKNAPILILDEATSALDTESERLVQDAIRRLVAGRTTLVIAHRLSTVERADQIIVLARGEIVEAGTHQQLIRHGGTYASLYRMQFADAS